MLFSTQVFLSRSRCRAVACCISLEITHPWNVGNLSPLPHEPSDPRSNTWAEERSGDKGTIETGPCLRVTGGCSHVYQGWSPAAKSLEHFKILNSLLLLAHFSQHGPVPSVCTAGRGLQDLLALGGSCCSSVFPQLRKPPVCCSPLFAVGCSCSGAGHLGEWSHSFHVFVRFMWNVIIYGRFKIELFSSALICEILSSWPRMPDILILPS